MKGLSKGTKKILAMICWTVVILITLQLSSQESFGQTPGPLKIKVELSGNQVRLTADPYSRCEWTSSHPNIISLNPASGKSTTGTALAAEAYNWTVVTCKCAYAIKSPDDVKYVSECLEFIVQLGGLRIHQGQSGLSRGESGVCQEP